MLLTAQQVNQGGYQFYKHFDPNFVTEIEDGRVLVVEYNREPYKTNDDSRG